MTNEFPHGGEQEGNIYFAYSASLRIFGNIPHFETISDALGFQPTETHRKGDRRVPLSEPYGHDMWLYRSPVYESEPLEQHIDALWAKLKPRKDYLLELKKTVTVDVFLGYRSNSDTAGVEVPHTSLEMFRELEIPFGLSIIVT